VSGGNSGKKASEVKTRKHRRHSARAKNELTRALYESICNANDREKRGLASTQVLRACPNASCPTPHIKVCSLITNKKLGLNLHKDGLHERLPHVYNAVERLF